jgi:hypothetical protein
MECGDLFESDWWPSWLFYNEKAMFKPLNLITHRCQGSTAACYPPPYRAAAAACTALLCVYRKLTEGDMSTLSDIAESSERAVYVCD